MGQKSRGRTYQIRTAKETPVGGPAPDLPRFANLKSP